MQGTLLDPTFGGLSRCYPTGQGVTRFEVRLEPLREDLRTWAGVTQVGSATAGIRANKCTLEIWLALKMSFSIKLDQQSILQNYVGAVKDCA
jgi:hypothetical protein